MYKKWQVQKAILESCNDIFTPLPGESLREIHIFNVYVSLYVCTLL
jgi:hypothetical protein